MSDKTAGDSHDGSKFTVGLERHLAHDLRVKVAVKASSSPDGASIGHHALGVCLVSGLGQSTLVLSLKAGKSLEADVKSVGSVKLGKVGDEMLRGLEALRKRFLV